jgi:hypothetical protein
MQEKAQQEAARKMEARKLRYGYGYVAQEMVQNDTKASEAKVDTTSLVS